jgi:cell division septal protein FtsQ
MAVTRPHRWMLERRGVPALVAAVLLCLAAWQIARGPLLTIETVHVHGATGADADTVRSAAALVGRRVFAADAGAATRRVEALPWVAHATVHVGLPGSATITVVPRTPIGVWRVGGVNYLVADDGVIVGTTDDAGPLPVVDAADDANARIGARIDPEPLRVAERINAFASAQLQQTITRISYGHDTGITVVAGKGVQIQFGDGDGLDYKLAVWQAMLHAVRPGELHVLDLRGSRPYYR